jgi:hypothetical protein
MHLYTFKPSFSPSNNLSNVNRMLHKHQQSKHPKLQQEQDQRHCTCFGVRLAHSLTKNFI